MTVGSTFTAPLAARLPALLLISANLIPLAGVLFWNWSLFQIVALYWLENLIIGAINLLKMLISNPDTEPAAAGFLMTDFAASAAKHGFKIALLPFFAFHYGLFCLVHGVFVFSLLGGEVGPMQAGLFSTLHRLIEKAVSEGGLWAVAALVGSHLFSFVYHFLIRGDFRRTTAQQLMGAPYGRVMVLHFAILAGSVAILEAGNPVFLLILLVAGKTVIDLVMHFRSHRTRRRPAGDQLSNDPGPVP